MTASLSDAERSALIEQDKERIDKDEWVKTDEETRVSLGLDAPMFDWSTNGATPKPDPAPFVGPTPRYVDPNHKRCAHCEKIKRVPEDFHKNKRTKDGAAIICRVCANAAVKASTEKAKARKTGAAAKAKRAGPTFTCRTCGKDKPRSVQVRQKKKGGNYKVYIAQCESCKAKAGARRSASLRAGGAAKATATKAAKHEARKAQAEAFAIYDEGVEKDLVFHAQIAEALKVRPPEPVVFEPERLPPVNDPVETMKRVMRALIITLIALSVILAATAGVLIGQVLR